MAVQHSAYRRCLQLDERLVPVAVVCGVHSPLQLLPPLAAARLAGGCGYQLSGLQNAVEGVAVLVVTIVALVLGVVVAATVRAVVFAAAAEAAAVDVAVDVDVAAAPGDILNVLHEGDRGYLEAFHED